MNNSICYIVEAENFSKIPGSPISYWISEKVFDIFVQNRSISLYGKPCKGIDTGDNNVFLRCWYEIDCRKQFYPFDDNDIDSKRYKWFPYNKGGGCRKWYGNNLYVLNWYEDGRELKSFKGSNLRNRDYYFNEGITWSTISSTDLSFRYFSRGFLFDNGGSCLFSDNNLLYIQAFLNSKIAHEFLQISPTLNSQPGDIGRLPLKIDKQKDNIIHTLVKLNIECSKEDWDSFETSWDFKKHPLI